MRLVLLIGLLLLSSCNPFNYWNDSPFEEQVEDKIQERTGIRIDLSGNTPDPVEITQYMLPKVKK